MVSWWHSMGTWQTQREKLIWKYKNFNLEHIELSLVKGELIFWNHTHKKIEQQSTISESTDKTHRHIIWRSLDNRIISDYYIVKIELDNYIKEDSQTIMVSANIRNSSIVCLATSIQHCTRGFGRTIGQEYEIKGIQFWWVKLSPFTDDVIRYFENKS